MTIDEAIKFCHEKSENIKLKAEPQVFIDIAEWLEELKEYKATNYPKCSECAGCTLWNCDCANIRGKAIDDYVERLKETFKPCKEADNYIYTNVCRRFDDVAEQLKENILMLKNE